MDAPAGTTLGDVTFEELQLSARNHAMPLEALRYPVTPVGLHYLLTHYDIPAVDPETWRLEIGGSVERPLSLSLAQLRERDALTVPVTLECAGNGRARLAPRPLSQPWLTEAVGTAEWTGVALGPLLAEAGLRDDAVEVLFTGWTAASRAASSRPTSAASRAPRRWDRTRCWSTRSTAARCRPSTGRRCGS